MKKRRRLRRWYRVRFEDCACRDGQREAYYVRNGRRMIVRHRPWPPEVLNG